MPWFLSRTPGCIHTAKQKFLQQNYVLKISLHVLKHRNGNDKCIKGSLFTLSTGNFSELGKKPRTKSVFSLHRCITGIIHFTATEPGWESGPRASTNAIWYLNGNFLCMRNNNASDLTFGFVVTKYYHMYNLTFLSSMNAWPWTPSNLLGAVKIISIHLQ